MSASCIACADVSLSENAQELIRVIRVALDCADACELTGRIAIRQSAPDTRLIRGVIEGCAAACLACAEECECHAAGYEQCRLCAEACRLLQDGLRRVCCPLTHAPCWDGRYQLLSAMRKQYGGHAEIAATAG
jgi:hypothetical protein